MDLSTKLIASPSYLSTFVVSLFVNFFVPNYLVDELVWFFSFFGIE